MDYMHESEEIFSLIRSLRHFPPFHEIDGLTAGEMAVLSHLLWTHDGASSGELSSVFSVGSPRTAAILNTLEHKGMAVRRPDPSDGRRVLVFITDKGRRITAERIGKANRRMAGLLARLGPHDTEELVRIIRRITELRDP